MSSWLILIAVVVVWYFGVCIVKELHARSKGRWEDRVWARYHQQEDIRAHHRRLAEIEEARRRTAEAMIRTAAEARGEVIDGTAIEVRRS
jgi:hypothetical protein